jgi:hypothetical protein
MLSSFFRLISSFFRVNSEMKKEKEKSFNEHQSEEVFRFTSFIFLAGGRRKMEKFSILLDCTSVKHAKPPLFHPPKKID